jgi:hypothetical protein
VNTLEKINISLNEKTIETISNLRNKRKER